MPILQGPFFNWLINFPRRFKRAIRPALISALAGLVAWPISYLMFGHELPLFATITAVVCLAPGIPNHGSQSLMVVLGVSIGFFLGEMIQLMHIQHLFISIPLATVLAMICAASFGFKPVVSIQASISAVLIIALGPQVAGLNRFFDVLVGASVALIFSQVIFTPSPMNGLLTAKDNFIERIVTALTYNLAALREQDKQSARVGTNIIVNAHQHLVVFDNAISAVFHTSKWTIRGRFAGENVRKLATHYDRRNIRLYAASVLLCESIGDGLRRLNRGEGPPPPQGLTEEMQLVIDEITQFLHKPLPDLEFHTIKPLGSLHGNITNSLLKEDDVWQRCYVRLLDVQHILQRITVAPSNTSSVQNVSSSS